MSIVKMKHLRLVGMRSDRDQLLHLLQHMGCVEISEPKELPPDPQWASLTRPDDSGLTQAKEARTAVQAALAVLKKYAPTKGGMFAQRPEVSEGELFNNTAYAANLEKAAQINGLEKEILALQAQQNKINNQHLVVAPWRSLDIPLDSQSTRDVVVCFGTLSALVKVEELQAKLLAATDLAELTIASTDREFHYLLLLCHASAEEEAMGVLKEYGFSRSNLRGISATAADYSAQLDGELKATEEQIGVCRGAIQALASAKGALELTFDRADQEIAREDAKTRLLDTQATFFLEGWVPVPDEGTLGEKLSRYTCCWETADPTEDEYPVVPIKLKNNKFTQPLNMVTEMYALPAYDGLDPNPLMAPFFILFYGIMMADMGYGLVMMGAALFGLKKLKAQGGMANLFGLMGLCGITTFIIGALTGSFFGDFLTQLLKIIDPTSNFVLPALFTPLTDTLAILIGSLIIGAIQVITGMVISVVKQTSDGKAKDAFFNEITWWIILGGAALAILGHSVGTYVLGAGFVILAIGQFTSKGILGGLGGLVGAVYNGVTGLFSDVLSYSRLMALMLAGSIISSVFNTLGSITNSVIPFILIALLGNALNFALNILGCYVHDLRLQCLEFFGRFYKDGGKPFKPLMIKTTYVNTSKEEQ